MSELKAFDVNEKTLFGRTYVKKVYLKSEADKVIAENESEIAQLQSMLEERNRQVGELKHSLELASNEICSISERAVNNERRIKRALYKALFNWAHYAVAFYGSYKIKEHWRKMENNCINKLEKIKEVTK